MEKEELPRTTGGPIADDQNSLTDGPRDPLLNQGDQLVEQLAHRTFNRRCAFLAWLVVAVAWFGPLAMPQALSAQEPKERASLEGHTAVVSSVAVTADGKTLATGSYDTTIKLWDVVTGKEIVTLQGHSGGVHSVAFTPDGKTLASGSQDDTVKLWDMSTGREIAGIKHGYHVRRVAFTPDGKTLISAGEGPLKLFDAATGKERATLDLVMEKANANLVLSLTLTADGKVLCTGHGNGTLKLWDLTTGKEKNTLRASDRPSERHIPSVAFTADGKTLACGLSSGAVILWDVATGEERVSIEAHRGRVWGLAVSPDGKTLASGAWDGTIKLWDVATGQEQARFAAHNNRVYALAFTPDGKTLVSGGGIRFKSGEVKLWDVAAIDKSGREKPKVVRDRVKGSIHHAGGKSEWERITGKAKVLDAHTLQFEDGTRAPLLIVAPDLDQMGMIDGSRSPCGKDAAEFLRKLIGDRPVTCYLVEAQNKWFGCVGDTNIEHEMILNGWALAHHSTMNPAEIIARENKRGLWRGRFIDPEEWRKGKRLPGEAPDPDGNR